MKLPHGYLADIKRIKAAGFSHFKVELEADLDRNGTDFDDESDCQEFMSGVSPEASAALVYAEFYNDGSVDSEYTFTMKIEDAHLAVEIMERFKALAREIGGGLAVERAGLHLTLLTEGTYPTTVPLNRANLANYTRQVTKLLPALYAASSHDGLTRELQFRTPKISPEKNGVYPAICTHDGTCLEFRLFDTCYERPEAILEKIQIIAATLKYWHPSRKLHLKSQVFVLEEVGTRSEHRPFANTIKDTANLAALVETIKFVKPSSVSLASFLKARGLNLSQTAVSRYARATDLREAIAYQAYTEQWKRSYNERLVTWLQNAHPTASTKAEIKALLPGFSVYNRQYQEPLHGYDTWSRQRSKPSPYTNEYARIDLTEAAVPPRMEFIYRSSAEGYTTF